jgi:hypothetical protein
MKKGIIIGAIVCYLLFLFTPLAWVAPSNFLEGMTNQGIFVYEECYEWEIKVNPYLVECFHNTYAGKAVDILILGV